MAASRLSSSASSSSSSRRRSSSDVLLLLLLLPGMYTGYVPVYSAGSLRRMSSPQRHGEAHAARVEDLGGG